jgi:hypothetical protein
MDAAGSGWRAMTCFCIIGTEPYGCTTRDFVVSGWV